VAHSFVCARSGTRELDHQLVRALWLLFSQSGSQERCVVTGVDSNDHVGRFYQAERLGEDSSTGLTISVEKSIFSYKINFVSVMAGLARKRFLDRGWENHVRF
jgi:hypothetical protein